MAKPIHHVIFKNDTLTLTQSDSENIGKNNQGFWLYDETRGMNLAMRAETERDAFIDALEYYQNRLCEVESKYKNLNAGVVAFVEKFTDDEDLSF